MTPNLLVVPMLVEVSCQACSLSTHYAVQRNRKLVWECTRCGHHQAVLIQLTVGANVEYLQFSQQPAPVTNAAAPTAR